MATSKKQKSTKLRALGFCGADDSVDPFLLGIICNSYPFVEFGVLFRPDKVSFQCARNREFSTVFEIVLQVFSSFF